MKKKIINSKILFQACNSKQRSSSWEPLVDVCGPFWRRGADTRSFPLLFSRRRRLRLLLLLLPLLPLLLSSSLVAFFLVFSPSLLASFSSRSFLASSRFALPGGANNEWVGPLSSFVPCHPFFFPLHPFTWPLRLACASLYTGARHESTLGGLAVSSSDSSRKTCCPLWPSHWLGLFTSPSNTVLFPLVSLGSFVRSGALAVVSYLAAALRTSPASVDR